MKFDVSLLVHDLGQMPALARFADDLGFDGIWTLETSHEPYLPLVLSTWKSRYGSYDHLARVKEWSAGSEEEIGPQE